MGTKEDLDVWGNFLCSIPNIPNDATESQPSMLVHPGFGTKTMESMIHAGATGIVIEAGNTLVVDREKTIAMADEHNITILVK